MYAGDHARSNAPAVKRALWRLLAFLLCFALVNWGVMPLALQAYAIPSGSMEGTILVGDRVYSERISYLFHDPEPGDIITFEDPHCPNSVLIKRVVATGGQTIDLVDGQVVVDGTPLDEPYVNGKPTYPLDGWTALSYPYTIPEDELWVMGDNRTNSQDSRCFGSVPVDSVTGKAVFTYWPLPRIGLLES
ncbi:MAG: signal peptidase I [Eggerthellaceae bacterium]|nr:signal peptidase I [Eggerthellaceae bacterium]